MGVVEPVIQQWAVEKPSDFPNYAAGSAGPAAADELLSRSSSVKKLGPRPDDCTTLMGSSRSLPAERPAATTIVTK